MWTPVNSILFVLLLSVTAIGHAEILQEVNWMDSLGDVKKVYPNATYTRMTPAWLKNDESFIKITGPGLRGTILILFDDSRPSFKNSLTQNADDPDYKDRELFTAMSKKPDDTALTVSWVRWVPDQPLPLERFKQRYGIPKCDYDQTMEPYCKWGNKALDAAMSDDKKLVLSITTIFTKAEKRAIYVRKYNWVPDELK